MRLFEKRVFSVSQTRRKRVEQWHMGPVLAILLIVVAIPYSLNVWWKARRARSERERSFIIRVHMAVFILSVFAAAAFALLLRTGRFFALPLIGAAGLAVRAGIRKAHARIQAEEGDPLSRAKRVN